MYPFLSWVKNTGPLDSNLIIIAKIGISQERIKMIITNEKVISNKRFNKRLNGSFNGIVLNVKTGITP